MPHSHIPYTNSGKLSAVGSLVTLKGMLFHMAKPNDEFILGYELVLNGTSLEYKGTTIYKY